MNFFTQSRKDTKGIKNKVSRKNEIIKNDKFLFIYIFLGLSDLEASCQKGFLDE